MSVLLSVSGLIEKYGSGSALVPPQRMRLSSPMMARSTFPERTASMKSE